LRDGQLKEIAMAGRQYQNVSYGLNQPLNLENPTPIIAKRNPTTSDFAFPTTIWTNTANNEIFILASVANNTANWVTASGGAGVFTSLTVTPGPISLTGTTTINTAGAAMTTIGTGGTGVVQIGNAVGNTSVTGTLTASLGLIATAGGLTVTAGGATITGTTSINTTGAATTNIGNGGAATGIVNIGNATGNTAVTGALSTTTSLAAGTTVTAGTGITSTTGNIVLGAAAASFRFSNGITITAGAINPNGVVAANIGSLFLTNNGTGVANRAWINTDGVTAWTAITTAS
jgi:hypothetical protein